MIENFQLGEEFRQFAGFEQVIGIARAASECALMDRKGFVEQQATGRERARDRGNQRAVEEAEYQNHPTTLTSERNLDWILKVCEERFDCQLALRGGFAKLREERSTAVDSNHSNASCSHGESVASATAGEVDDHAQLGRGPDWRELVSQEVRRRRSLRHRLNGQRANR